MPSIKECIELIRKLPLSLNFTWLLMHVGLGFMLAGMLNKRWLLSAIGAGLIAFVMRGEMAARFSTPLIFTALGGGAMMAIVVSIFDGQPS